jgi:hypothetical protein
MLPEDKEREDCTGEVSTFGLKEHFRTGFAHEAAVSTPMRNRKDIIFGA